MGVESCYKMVLGLLVCLVVIYSANGSDYKNPHCVGNRHGIVHLFEWRWDDVANECKDFLGPYGFCGVQISPPSENRVISVPNRPWFERYQPVSYKLITRSGNETQFKNMVKTCNDNGVRIFADVVINHMTKIGFSGFGTGGSKFDSHSNKMLFPGVPYGPLDFNGFNCHSYDGQIHDYKNSEEVRNCRLKTLLDLQLGKDYVRQKVADYMNHLIDLGVAGFRIDAAKHMWPGDIKPILNLVKNVQQGGKPLIYQEVIELEGTNEAVKAIEYINTGRVTNFKFGIDLAQVFSKKNAMKWLRNFGTAWGMWSSKDVVNFIDNHDNQRGDGGGGNVLTFKNSKPYKMATAFMLAHPYGVSRIMSSYDFKTRTDGPPHYNDMRIKPVTFHDGMLCNDGWICEHRWRQIYNMVAFRNMAKNTPVMNWWSGADYQIAFSRGNNAFIAFNLENYDINTKLQTGLPNGTYCDVISGDLVDGICTGHAVSVDKDGMANIYACSNCDDPMLAIHIGAKVDSAVMRY